MVKVLAVILPVAPYVQHMYEGRVNKVYKITAIQYILILKLSRVLMKKLVLRFVWREHRSISLLRSAA